MCKCAIPIISNQGQINVEKVVIDFDDSLGHNYKYSIGAYCVSENMAYAIENYLYPNILPTPSKMPYESVKIMCDYLLPGFSNDPLNIIALCDSCMLLFNPGVFIFDTLQLMANISFIPQRPEDIYDFVYSNIKFNKNGHTTIQQLFISTAAEAISQLGDYYTTPLFKDNRTWINYVITSAVDLRIRDPYFFLNIVRNGTLFDNSQVKNTFFVRLLHKLGSPIVINDNSEITFIPPSSAYLEIRPEYFWVFDQIYNIFKEGIEQDIYKCEMIDYCNLRAMENKIGEYTNEQCRYDPWSRSTDADPNPCLFGQVWKTWGLENEIPKSKIVEE